MIRGEGGTRKNRRRPLCPGATISGRKMFFVNACLAARAAYSRAFSRNKRIDDDAP